MQDSGTIQVSGLVSRFYDDAGKTVLVDAGGSLVDNASGELLRSGNNHPIDDYFRGDPTALQAICDAIS